MSDTNIETQPVSHVNPPIPDAAEKRWVVAVCEVKYGEDENGEDRKVLIPDHVLSPKGGGPASLLNATTWGDRSMATSRARMVIEKNRRNWTGLDRALRLGFVHEGRLFWPNGQPATERLA